MIIVYSFFTFLRHLGFFYLPIIRIVFLAMPDMYSIWGYSCFIRIVIDVIWYAFFFDAWSRLRIFSKIYANRNDQFIHSNTETQDIQIVQQILEKKYCPLKWSGSLRKRLLFHRHSIDPTKYSCFPSVNPSSRYIRACYKRYWSRYFH